MAPLGDVDKVQATAGLGNEDAFGLVRVNLEWGGSKQGHGLWPKAVLVEIDIGEVRQARRR